MKGGRLVIPALHFRRETGFTHEAEAIDRALELGVGGFLLFGGSADSAADLTARLRRDAGRPLLLAADLERGPGQQFEDLDELPPARALASLGDPAVLRGAGVLTAVEALSIGVNWVLAPVLDLDLEPENPILQARSFGDDPAGVAAAGAAWIVGCEAAGALACAKHFPGHGRTRVDSHLALPVVEASPEALRADLEPFAAAVLAGVSSVMTAHVAYPALDPTGAPATYSAPILGILRHELGFAGLIVSDSLTMAGARQGLSEVEGARRSIEAGVDLLLYPESPGDVVRGLADQSERDHRFGARVEAALERYQNAIQQVGEEEPYERIPPAGSARAVGDWLLSRPLLRGEIPRLKAPIELMVVDDDSGELPSSRARWLEQALAGLGIGLGSGGSRVLLAVSEPRPGKRAAGFGPASRDALEREGPLADLVVLFTHPRHLAAVPGQAPVLLAWDPQRLMQEAVARWLAERVG